MASTSQSSTRLLSILIQCSYGAEVACTPICSIRRSIRFLSTTKSSRLSTPGRGNPPALSDRRATLLGAKTAAGGSLNRKHSRPKAPASTSVEKIETQPTSQLSRRPLQVSAANRKNSRLLDLEANDSKTDIFKRSRDEPVTDIRSQRPREHWQMQKDALKEKFGEQGWSPRKKLSPDTMEGIRALHEQFPQKYTTSVLAEQFKISPEAIRRILKSKWRATPEKMEERRARWAKRHDRIWDAQAEMGLRPQRKKDRKPEGPEKLDETIPLMPNVGS